MKFVLRFILVALLSAVPFTARGADTTPVQIALFNPVQIFPEQTKVEGVRIDLLYGVNSELSGVDWGLANRTIGTTTGMQIGAFPFGGVNITGNLEGVQLGGLWGGVNIAHAEVTGLQFAGILWGFNRAGSLHGGQIAGVFAGINIADSTDGFQLATLYNQATRMHGLQLGLVNVCRQASGVQIGLVNVIRQSELPFLPIVNARF